MILKEAVEIMKAHNEWRRGAETEMVNPKELGVAIDVLINHAEASQPSGGKSAEEIEQWYYKWLSDRNKSGIVTENVLDMLKDFAASQQPVNDGWVRVEKEKLEKLYLIAAFDSYNRCNADENKFLSDIESVIYPNEPPKQ